MSAKKEISAELVSYLKTKLAPLGFVKRRGPIFTVPLSLDARGSLGLNIAQGGTADPLTVNPVVGVRYDPIAELISRLRPASSATKQYFVPTISCSLGYLVPPNRYKVWQVREPGEVPGRMDELVDELIAFGLPFMQRSASLEGIMQGIEHQLIPSPDEKVIVSATALTIGGDAPKALAEVDAYEAGLAGRQDPAAQSFRTFAQALRRQIAE